METETDIEIENKMSEEERCKRVRDHHRNATTMRTNDTARRTTPNDTIPTNAANDTNQTWNALCAGVDKIGIETSAIGLTTFDWVTAYKRIRSSKNKKVGLFEEWRLILPKKALLVEVAVIMPDNASGTRNAKSTTPKRAVHSTWTVHWVMNASTAQKPVINCARRRIQLGFV